MVPRKKNQKKHQNQKKLPNNIVMALNPNKLKSSKQLILDIDDLEVRKKQLFDYNDDSILKYIMDMDIRLLSSSVSQDMADVTEAYRMTIINLIDSEIENKLNLLNKIRLKDE